MGSLFQSDPEPGVLHGHFATLVHILEWAAAIIDIAAIFILLIGAIRFILGVARAEFTRDTETRVRTTNLQRVELGRYILAGLELFIVSDVIHTALSLQVEDLFFLLILVIIRAIISFFLERELEQIRTELDP